MNHFSLYTFGISSYLLFICFSYTVHHVTGKDLLRSNNNQRQLAECDPLDGCYFVNIQTRQEMKLNGTDTITIDPTEDNLGYSIRCDVIDSINGTFNVMKFKYNNIVHNEYDIFRYMDGDSSNNRYINRASYFDTCGSKQVTVEGHIWTAKCFEKTYNIQLLCSCPMEISDFIVVDATRRTDVMVLNDYNQATMSQNLNIRAVVPTMPPPQCDTFESVHSVLFELDGVTVRCESYTPFALFGDSSRFDLADPNRAKYYSQTIAIGTHTVRATPFNGEDCTSTAGTPLTRTFTVSP
jgi:hypothetical protein